ncbi:MAG: NAD(P)-dependent oxidoreductase [Actinomycetota bacterium]
MHLTIVAATGRIGQLVLEQAVDAGHDVTAVSVDLSDPDTRALEMAVVNADAVLSGLGPRKRSENGITSKGTRAIVAAMQATGARRLVVVSAAPIGTMPSPDHPRPPKHDPGDGFFMRHLFAPIARTAFREHYVDLGITEDLVRDSGLDWTIVRPPRLTDGRLTGTYRTALGRNVRGGFSVSRADVANLMLRVIDDPESIKETIGVAS